MRRIWIGLGMVFVLLIAGLIGLDLWVNAYLRSEAFRKLVSAKTGQALKADADYETLDWTGSSVYSESMKAQGEAGSPLEAIDAEQVRADVDWRAIFQGAWRVDRVDIARVDAVIRTQAQQSATANEPGPTPEPQPRRHGFLPNRFELDRVAVQDANVTIGALARIQSTALMITPQGSGWIFNGNGGKVDLGPTRQMEIDSFHLRLQQRMVYLTDSSLRFGANGSLKISGEAGGSDVPFQGDVTWQDVDIADLLQGPWKDRLSGALSGRANIVGRAGNFPRLAGNFHLTDGQLTGLPVQKQIADFTRSPQFERMPIQEISGDYTYDGQTTVVKNFVAESQGLLRLEGDCRIGGDGSIQGTFRVGVTAQSLQWLPGSQEKVFLTSENGYLWTTVEIGGTLQNPTENLSHRLAGAVGEKAIETGVELLQGSPSNATDAVKKAVDLLTPLLP